MDTDKILKTRIYRDIIEFFHENQSSIDTPRGVATWIKEERPVVKKALEKLSEYGILMPHRATSTTGYSYTRNRKLIREIGAKLRKLKQ